MGKLYSQLRLDQGNDANKAPAYHKKWGRQARVWIDTAGKQFPTMLPAITKTIKEISKNEQVYKGFTLPLDLEIMRTIGSQANTYPKEELRKFAQQSHGIVADYATQANALTRQIMSEDLGANKAVEKVDELKSGLNQAQEALKAWEKTLSNVSGQESIFPKEIKDVAETIGKWSNTISNVGKDLDVIIKQLFGNTLKVPNLLNSLYAQVDEIYKKLKAPGIDASTVPGLRAQLNFINQEITRQQGQLDQVFEDISKGVDLVGGLIGLAGNKQLANKVVAIGNAGITIARNLALVLGGSLATGPAAPFVAIAGALVVIVASFLNNGPSTEEVIGQHIQKLSEHVDQRFDRIEDMIKQGVKALGDYIDKHFEELDKRLNNRFKAIATLMGEYFQITFQNFSGLYAQGILIEEGIQQVRLGLDQLEQKVNAGFRELLQDTYTTVKVRVFDWKTDIYDPESRQQRGNDYLYLKKFLSSTISGETLAGKLFNSGQSSGDVPQARAVAQSITSSGLGSSINTLLIYAKSAHNISAPSMLFNPEIWADGVRTLLALSEQEMCDSSNPHPVVYENPLQNTLRSCMSNGRRYQTFISGIQKDDKLFESLIEKYLSALKEVILAACQVVIEPAVYKEESPERALMIVQGLEAAPQFIQSEIDEVYVNPDALPVYAGEGTGDIDKAAFLRDFMHAVNLAHVQEHDSYGKFKDLIERLDTYGVLTNGDPTFTIKPGFAQKVSNAALKPHRTARDEWQAAVAKAAALRSNYDAVKSRTDALKNAEYIAQQKLAILKNAMLCEVNKAVTNKRLPHLALMEKYFSIVNQMQLNALLGNNQDPLHAKYIAELKGQLEQLEDAHQWLSIFIAAAFPEEYMNNPQCNALLETLWDRDDFYNYLKKPTGKFVIIEMQTEIIPIVTKLKDFLLAKVAVMKAPGHKTGHSLVEGVLEEITSFQDAHFPNSAPVELQLTAATAAAPAQADLLQALQGQFASASQASEDASPIVFSQSAASVSNGSSTSDDVLVQVSSSVDFTALSVSESGEVDLVISSLVEDTLVPVHVGAVASSSSSSLTSQTNKPKG